MNAATRKRNSSRALAQSVLIGALAGCQPASYSAGVSLMTNALILSWLGPEAPVIVGVVGAAVFDLGCMTLAAYTYHHAAIVIESDFVIDKIGCGCN